MEKVFDIYIRTTPERLWEAITDKETRKRYTFQPPPGMEPGGFAEGGTVESDPPHRLVETMEAHWSPEVESHPETRITYEILPWGDEITGLRVTHGELEDDASEELYGGWPHILSSLKSLLETGEPLNLQVPPEAVERWRAERGAV
ncbi:MAG: SRPBCC domain-containing protein [Actinomycetota bacterium]|nr:SRPBCC domain-containing protein [Actinomycetota bacterium]